MIPITDLIPQLSRGEPIRLDPHTARMVAYQQQHRVDLSDMQETVDRIHAERNEKRANDTLMSTLIYSVWRRGR